MGKIKTSDTQEKSSPRELKLKSWEGLKVIHPEETLLDEKRVANAILECLKDNDTEALMDIIEGYLSALNRSKFAKEKNISRSTIYHSLKKRNPTIKTLAKIVHAACH